MSAPIPSFVRNLFNRDQLGGRYIGLILLVVASCFAWAEHRIFNYFEWLFDYLPTSIFLLSVDNWYAVLMTAITSCVAFLLCWPLAYAVGMLAAICIDSNRRRFAIPAHLFDNLMDFMYIVPIALTIAIVFIPVAVAYYHDEIHHSLVAVTPLLIGTFVLSGYQVYDFSSKAMASPDDRGRKFIDAIYISSKPSFIWIITRTMNRRVDLAIRAYGQTLFRSLHLSFVAVVIVEMVIPQIYTYLFGTMTVNEGLLFGIGGRVSQLSQDLHLEQIAGMIWALAGFDALAQGVLRSWFRSSYERHYVGAE